MVTDLYGSSGYWMGHSMNKDSYNACIFPFHLLSIELSLSNSTANGHVYTVTLLRLDEQVDMQSCPVDDQWLLLLTLNPNNFN